MKPSAKTRPAIHIEPFEPRFAADFERLNVEWLERFFCVEPVDAEVLGDPQTHIIAPGGAILMAISASVPVGTVALKLKRPRVFELTKMAVTAPAQGCGAGRLLVDGAIEVFRQRRGELLFLESHSSLKAALGLYASVGFEHAPRPFKSEYQRSDVYMEWRTPGDGL